MSHLQKRIMLVNRDRAGNIRVISLFKPYTISQYEYDCAAERFIQEEHKENRTILNMALRVEVK